MWSPFCRWRPGFAVHGGNLKVCCCLTAKLFRRVIAAELVDSFILPYIVAINSHYKGSMSLNSEEDVGIDDREIQQ